MIIRVNFVWGLVLLLVTLCLTPPVFAESDLESLKKEIAAQREKLTEQIRTLEVLEKRLDEATRTPASAVPPTAVSETKPAGRPVQSGKDAAQAAKSDQPEREPIVGVSQREKLYGSFSDVGFAKSVPLFGSDWRFSFGGYVKLDVIHDFDGTGDELQFTTPSIPVKGAPGPQSGSYTNIHARETRFSFDVRNAREGLPFNKGVIEMDFFDASNTAPRLRHAYLQWGNLIAGQTWTTLSVLPQLPFLLDFAYGDALYGGRAAQIRWDQKIDANWSWAVAIEDWVDDAVANPYDLPGKARSEWPLFALRGNYAWSRGTLSLGTSLAQMRWDGTDGIGDESKLSWAIVGGGRLYLDSANRHYLGFGGSYGHGTASNLINLIEGGAANAFLKPSGSLHLLDNWNGQLALHYEFSKKWSTNWNIAYGGTNPDKTLFPNALKGSGAAHANLIYQFAPEFLIGAEYMIGIRKNADGADGTAQRIQFSAMYSF
jgi:hypothetical protein